jgi:hypothetical protein
MTMMMWRATTAIRATRVASSRRKVELQRQHRVMETHRKARLQGRRSIQNGWQLWRMPTYLWNFTLSCPKSWLGIKGCIKLAGAKGPLCCKLVVHSGFSSVLLCLQERHRAALPRREIRSRNILTLRSRTGHEGKVNCLPAASQPRGLPCTEGRRPQRTMHLGWRRTLTWMAG